MLMKYLKRCKPWNNASDRILEHGVGRNKGIDIKHNSYDRYLARKKSQYIKTENDTGLLAKYGNKTFKLVLLDLIVVQKIVKWLLYNVV